MKTLEFTINDETKDVKFTDAQCEMVAKLHQGEDRIIYDDDYENLIWECSGEKVNERVMEGAMEKISKAFDLTEDEKEILRDRFISEW